MSCVRCRLYGSTLVRGAPLTDTFTLRHPFIPFEYDKMVMEADSVFLLKVRQGGTCVVSLHGSGEAQPPLLRVAVHNTPMVTTVGAASTPAPRLLG